MFRIVKLSKDEWALSFRKGKIVKVLSFTKGFHGALLNKLVSRSIAEDKR